MPEHKITLRQKASPHSLERHPRYDVLVNGEKKSELCYNMTGYVGTLPTVSGFAMDIGERGITAFRKEVSALNARARAAIGRGLSDPQKIVLTRPTSDSRSLFAISRAGDDPDTTRAHILNRREHLQAKALLGTDAIGAGFYHNANHDAPSADGPEILLLQGDGDLARMATTLGWPARTLTTLEAWEHDSYVDAVYETSDPEVRVVIGRGCADDADPEPYYVTRQSLAFGRASLGENLRIGDLDAADPVRIADPKARSELRAMFTWIDLDPAEDAAARHQREQDALSRGDALAAERGEPLDAAQRHQVGQESLTGPET